MLAFRQYEPSFSQTTVYRLCILALHPESGLIFRVGFRKRFTCGSISRKNVIWSKNFGGQQTWWSYDAAPSPNGGMAIATMTASGLTEPWNGYSNRTIKLYKTDANGSLSNACHQWNYPATAGNMDFVDSSMTVMTPAITAFIKHDTLIVPVQPRSQMRFVCPDYVPLCSFMEVTKVKTPFVT